jgi:hypothetical protein
LEQGNNQNQSEFKKLLEREESQNAESKKQLDKFKLELESVKSKQTQQLEEHAKKNLQLEESIRNEKAAKDQATERCQAIQNALDSANKKESELNE